MFVTASGKDYNYKACVFCKIEDPSRRVQQQQDQQLPAPEAEVPVPGESSQSGLPSQPPAGSPGAPHRVPHSRRPRHGRLQPGRAGIPPVSW